MSRSIEENVEDYFKCQLKKNHVDYYEKTDFINDEIERALEKSPSKTSGSGGNYPDIKCFIKIATGRVLPVMIECKGSEGRLVKKTDDGQIANLTKKDEPNYSNISKFAVNGAVHYANAILNYTYSYKECLAIGINGYKNGDEIKYELGVYYLSKDNLNVPKKVDSYSSLGFLNPKYINELKENLQNINLTSIELEKQKLFIEDKIDGILKKLNQKMYEDWKIESNSRVYLVISMLLAGIGVDRKVLSLKISDLKGNTGENANDGQIILDKVKGYLKSKKIPDEKASVLINILKQRLINSSYLEKVAGETKLKKIYIVIYNEILSIFKGEHKLDFIGKLFNIFFNTWVQFEGDEKNDVVLTPRYIVEFMVKLAEVNKDSYVWDYAAGSGGFLIAAMDEMLKDADEISDPAARDTKKSNIKQKQLLGIELRQIIFAFSIFNMLLMGDGSANLIQDDSLSFDGKYKYGKHKGEIFPADVFLLNPPYSAKGKGMIFVEKALFNMKKNSKAVILIQENAGAGKGTPYTKEILKHSTLLASIKMNPQVFIGKSNVQTAIYVFHVGTGGHKKDNIVKFFNMTEDGYSRLNRPKSKQSVNLKNTDHAIERYNEVLNKVLNRETETSYYTKENGNYIEDTISLEGNDWTFTQHQIIDITPTENDFRKTIGAYLSWQASQLLNME